MRKNGITLIALVITVIVLLILAGVALSTFSSQDGLLTKVNLAQEEYTKTVDEETMIFEDVNSMFFQSEDKWNGEVAEGFAGGTGKQQDPYIITNAAELAYLAQCVNTKTSTFAGEYIEITKDINLSGHEWVGIGYDETGTLIDNANNIKFAGNLNGNNYCIHGMTMIREEKTGSGLFGVNWGTISNLKIKYMHTKAWNTAGGLTAINRGEISNIVIDRNTVIETAAPETGNYRGRYSGGVASYNYGNIDNCVNYGTMITRESRAGGIVGQSGGGLISNCTNYGNIKCVYERQYSEYGCDIGGVVGYLYHGEIRNSYNYGEVEGKSSVGGITGVLRTNDTIVSGCKNYGKIQGNSDIGGIAGELNNGYVKQSTNFGNVEGGTAVGGIAGYQFNASKIEDSTNNGTVSATKYVVGGVLGYMAAGEVLNCANTGSVESIEVALMGVAGGVIGYQGGGTTTNVFNMGPVTVGNSANRVDTVGGIIGTQTNGTITTAYNRGILIQSPEKEENDKIGGVAGKQTGGTITNAYYYALEDSGLGGIGVEGEEENEITRTEDLYNSLDEFTRNHQVAATN
ncbi:MAG: hypothetical protein IKP28_00545 [Clostridia bacterium]|nr:hypothetical protein [Clostridia bacterium]